MSYQHQFLDGSVCDLPVGKVVCVGRNYAAHARELGNEVPEAPILFLKPSTSIVPLEPSFSIPEGRGGCHHEAEICVLIGKTLKNVSADEARAGIAGLGMGLDLTLRDIQNELKKKGHPWEIAKAFDGAAPIGGFVSAEHFGDLANAAFELKINGETRQKGNSEDMITPIIDLIEFISRIFTLQPGDVIMTGTPEGVAALKSGDVIEMTGPSVSYKSRVN